MSYEKLTKEILSMEDEMVEGIRRIVAIDSIKGEPEEGAPFGAGPKKALVETLKMAEEMGFKTGMVGNHVGYAEYGEGEEMVGVLGHLDVVPLGEGWIYPPFAGEIHDGIMYGRGVLDDKGPIIGALYCLKAIKNLGLKLDRRIRVMFGTDEESGSGCVKYYVESGAEMPTIGFTPDAEFPLIFFEKGTSNFTIGKKAPEMGRVISLQGGTASNVVTPKCVLKVNGTLDVTETEGVTVEEENGVTTVTAIGNGAHGSTPELGENAAIKLLTAVNDKDLGQDFDRMKAFLLEKLGTETCGKILDVYYTDEETGETTVNLGMIRMDSAEMSFTLDIRYPKNAVKEDVKAHVTEAAKAYALDILACGQVDCLYVPKDSELVTKLTKVYRTCSGDESAMPKAIGGGTYAKTFPNMVAFGPEFPGEPAPIHQPNEGISVKRLLDGIAIVGCGMYELAVK